VGTHSLETLRNSGKQSGFLHIGIGAFERSVEEKKNRRRLQKEILRLQEKEMKKTSNRNLRSRAGSRSRLPEAVIKGEGSEEKCPKEKEKFKRPMKGPWGRATKKKRDVARIG